MSSRYGNKRLKLQLFGQSHAEAVGAIIEGLPVGMEIDAERLSRFMARRAPGQSALTTARREADEVEILSGTLSGRVTNAPLAFIIRNTNARPSDYSGFYSVPRPGHGDMPALMRYGESADIRGGGHRSGRLTAPLCAAGALAVQALEFENRNISIGAHLFSVGDVYDMPFDPVSLTAEQLKAPAANAFPTVSREAGKRMSARILAAKDAGDSVGAIVEAAALGVCAGVGEPFFCSLDAALAQLFFALPGVKGFEMGAGFAAAKMCGSENNDAYIQSSEGGIAAKTNNSGGVLGGMSTGMPIIARAAFKPTASISARQESVNIKTGESAELSVGGRHDPCIAVRAVPLAEALMALALFDLI